MFFYKAISLYSGITNLYGRINFPNIQVTENTLFTSEYGDYDTNETIEYCTFTDYGVTNNNNSNWDTKSGNLTRTVYENYVELTQTGTSATYLGVNIPTDCKIIFDVYVSGGTVSNYFYRIDNGSWGGYHGGEGVGFIGGSLNTWLPVEVTFKDKQISTKNLNTGTINVNSSAQSTVTSPVFRFWMGSGKTIRYRDFRVIEL